MKLESILHGIIAEFIKDLDLFFIFFQVILIIWTNFNVFISQMSLHIWTCM